MATPIGIANFLLALATSAGTLLTFPGMTTLSAGINSTTTTIPITAWPWMFPLAGNFIIVIGTETMTVTAGHGTTSLTVAARSGGTTHAGGDAITWKNPLRVLEGSTPTDQTTGDGQRFIQRIQLDGPALKIKCPKMDGVDDHTRRTDYTIACLLYFGIDQNKTRSLSDVVSLLEQLKTLWFSQATFPAGSASAITNLTWEEPDIDYVQNPAFATLPITIHTRR